jgi:hypothetical protein
MRVGRRRANLVPRSVAFDPADWRRLDKLAAREQRSVSSLVRAAVRRALSQNDSGTTREERRK